MAVHQKKLEGKLVYITGGSSGIGLATAKACLSQGASVHLLARRRDKLSQAVETLSSALSPTEGASKAADRITFSVIDVASPEQIEEELPRAFSSVGIPQVLINCAGMSRPGYFEELSLDILRTTIETNLLGTLNVSSLTYRAMINAKIRGHIVNVSSMAGLVGVFGYTAYGASKFGIVGFSEALRSEAKRYGIRVSVLCPPDTETPQLEEENKYKPPETRAVAGNAKLLQPDVVAQALVSRLFTDRFIIFPDSMSALIFGIKRYAPRLVEFFMDQDIRKAQKDKRK
jgi:NAD(P)-dependent dehydrogenase (short-subunit alcohol dehydrogenase family)